MQNTTNLKDKFVAYGNSAVLMFKGIFGATIGGILALGALSLGVTIMLLSLGFSAVFMLFALPIGGWIMAREKTRKEV